jgi:copper chaperone CopZ
MTCEPCTHEVAGELKGLDGVREVRVDLHPGGESAVALDEVGDYVLAG